MFDWGLFRSLHRAQLPPHSNICTMYTPSPFHHPPQFLESAYGFSLDDSNAVSQYDVSKDLLDIFVDAVGSAADPPPSAEEIESRKTRAEERKTKGNELMKSERYEEALAAYTDAISLNNKNAVYFCNRAAAHSKLGNHQEAVDDCVTALEIDPTYSKAYGRMG